MTQDARLETRDAQEFDSIRSPLMSQVAGLPYAHGGPLGSGRIREQPEDFIVREQLGFEPSGVGEHVLLTVLKREANTTWVAKQLAQRAGVRVRDVGYAGLKDRYALTEQAFTVPSKLPPEQWVGVAGGGFKVLAAARHGRKLPRGAHRGNRFEITIRNFVAEPQALAERLHRIATHGIPNYFGAQRFGHDESNLARAEQWLCAGIAPPDRDSRGFALSAARAALFNAVLAHRVREGTWDCLLPGEAVNLDGTASVFVATTIDARLVERCVRLDVHPTGPLCGVGNSLAQAEALERERAALVDWQNWIEGLVRLDVRAERRALRVAVHELVWEYTGDTLKLYFRLTRGAFATSVLREVVASQ